jgi:hypothetical protein
VWLYTVGWLVVLFVESVLEFGHFEVKHLSNFSFLTTQNQVHNQANVSDDDRRLITGTTIQNGLKYRQKERGDTDAHPGAHC